MPRDRLHRDEFFHALLDTIVPRGGLALFLQAYFDASERGNGAYCVAGYGFTPKQAKNFTKQWRKMLGDIPYFRTADLLARQGVFRGISCKERDRIMKRAVAIVREFTAVSVIVLCRRSEVDALAPTRKPGLRGPYPICCYFCMALLGQWLDKRSPRVGDIAYFFESGDEYAGEASAVMDKAKSSDGIEVGLDKFYRYYSHAFVGKEDAPPLQAADLLAWEWTKFKDETIDRWIGEASGEPRRVRRSLEELMKGNPDNFLERILTSADLKNYYTSMEGYDLLPPL